MSARVIPVYRRCAFEIRRDAATPLSNGRVRYDALFSRWGVQAGEGGVEFRPKSEVFDDPSMASIAQLPGVLLHPDANFGTSFGEGGWPVRGVTGDVVVSHTDGIHTSGTLMVWDDAWNAAIEATDESKVADLSLGYSILADETPGTAPADAPGVEELGRDYVLSHTRIIGDHCAGVPEGNAGTARVVTDASQFARVTRRALADIAAQRRDAKPMIFDLGSRAAPASRSPSTPKQDRQPMNPTQFAKLLSRLDTVARQIAHDAWVDIYGETDDPDIKAAMAAMSGSSAPTTPAPAAPASTPAPVADADRSDLVEEREGQWVVLGEDGEVISTHETEEQAIEAEAALAEVVQDDRRADALTVARSVFGPDYQRPDTKGYSRLDTVAIQRAVIGKLDPDGLKEIRRLDSKQQPGGIALGFARARSAVTDRSDYGRKLADEINRVRTSTAARTPADARLVEVADLLKKQREDAATHTFGSHA